MAEEKEGEGAPAENAEAEAPAETEAPAASAEDAGGGAAEDLLEVDDEQAKSYGKLATMVAIVSFVTGPLLAFVFAEEFNIGSVALWTILMLSGLVVLVFVLPGFLGMTDRISSVIKQVNTADVVTQPQMKTLQTAAYKRAKAKAKNSRTSTQDLIRDDDNSPTLNFDGRELVVAKDPSRHTQAWVPLPKMLSVNIRGVRGKLLGNYTCVAAIYLDPRTPMGGLPMPLEDVADRAIDALEHTFDVATAPLSHHELAIIMLDATQRALGFTTVLNLAVSKGKIEDSQGEDRVMD
ncbi:MAG: hypothetical protein NXI16_12530 [Alphaproteobacteria bacterium]|nr:hypothetical protein [Alphaproteobacteria bacterium]